MNATAEHEAQTRLDRQAAHTAAVERLNARRAPLDDLLAKAAERDGYAKSLETQKRPEIVVLLSQGKATAADVADVDKEIAGARRDAAMYREAAAQHQPDVEELSRRAQQTAERLRQAQFAAEHYLPLLDVDEKIRTALAPVKSLFEEYKNRLDAAIRAYEGSNGRSPNGVDGPDARLGRFVSTWIAQALPPNAAAFARRSFPPESGSLTAGLERLTQR